MSYIELENLSGQVPERIAADTIMDAIYTAQAQAVDQWLSDIWFVLDQVFPLTAEHEGLSRLEHEARIQPQNFGDIARRRSVLLGKIRGEGTVTKAAIQEIVEAFGYGKVEVQVHASAFLVEIAYADRLGLPSFQDDVEAELLRKLPAHLEVKFLVRYMVWDTLDGMMLTWDAQDALSMSWDEFEKWEG